MPKELHKQSQLNLNLQTLDDRLGFEKSLWGQGIKFVAGVDEAGRGAWAGPVVAAAVILKPYTSIKDVDDSKKLSPEKREELYECIIKEALSFGIGTVESPLIDEMNILEASLLAMRLAVAELRPQPGYILVDGNRGMGLNIPQKTLVKGDGRSIAIGAASILAKVHRDRLMCNLEKKYPLFHFSIHKGYGTKLHQDEVKNHGPKDCHRFSFEPMRSWHDER